MFVKRLYFFNTENDFCLITSLVNVLVLSLTNAFEHCFACVRTGDQWPCSDFLRNDHIFENILPGNCVEADEIIVGIPQPKQLNRLFSEFIFVFARVFIFALFCAVFQWEHKHNAPSVCFFFSQLNKYIEGLPLYWSLNHQVLSRILVTTRLRHP